MVYNEEPRQGSAALIIIGAVVVVGLGVIAGGFISQGERRTALSRYSAAVFEAFREATGMGITREIAVIPLDNETEQALEERPSPGSAARGQKIEDRSKDEGSRTALILEGKPDQAARRENTGARIGTQHVSQPPAADHSGAFSGAEARKTLKPTVGGMTVKAPAKVGLPTAKECASGALGDSRREPTALVRGEPSHAVVINEIAWMGSPAKSGETASRASAKEWIEIKNRTSVAVELEGWQLIDQEGGVRIIFDGSDRIGPNRFFLLERTDDDSVTGIRADKIYKGALGNDGAHLLLYDANCNLVDAIDATEGWEKYGGESATRKTLERNVDDLGWHTSISPGGTPREVNSAGVPSLTTVSAAAPLSSTPVLTSSPKPSPPPPPRFTLTVTKSGSGSGIVSSEPVGISCGSDCSESYVQGEIVTLTAIPSSGFMFTGWSGPCTGGATCVLTIDRMLSVGAVFSVPPSPLVASSPPPQEQENATSPPGQFPPTAGGISHIVIAEVQITGGPGNTTNDFVRIFNPLSTPFNLKGHRLVKRAAQSTGDTTLKSWTTDTLIAPGSYYTWANSSFTTLLPPPDSVTTGSIADNNSIAIREGPENSGRVIDAVAWGAVQNSLMEGNAYSENPGANQVLSRKGLPSAPQDTDNNSEDFELR